MSETSPFSAGGERVSQARELVIVAGPSASGKTSFIRQVRSRSLPDAIGRALPAGVEAWPVVDPKRLSGLGGDGGYLASLESAEGVVVHYDTLRPRYLGLAGHGVDPALRILSTADRAVVVDIRAPARVLVEQHEGRLTRQERLARLKRLVRRLKRRLRGAANPAGEARLEGFSILDFYLDAERLETLYAEWDRFLERERSRRDIEVVRIEPVPARSGSPRFRLYSERESE